MLSNHKKGPPMKPPLERRHFDLIAATIRRWRMNEASGDLAEYFATALAKTNPRFDQCKFIEACRATTDRSSAHEND
jgi:hypothetical protein